MTEKELQCLDEVVILYLHVILQKFFSLSLLISVADYFSTCVVNQRKKVLAVQAYNQTIVICLNVHFCQLCILGMIFISHIELIIDLGRIYLL